MGARTWDRRALEGLGNSLDAREYLRLIQRSWLWLLCWALAGLAAGAAAIFVLPVRYEATAKSFVSTGSGSSVADLSLGNTFTQQIVKSYASVATTPYVLSSVIRDLKLPYSVNLLQENVSAVVETDTVVIDVQVNDSSAKRAAAIANAISGSLSTAVPNLTPEASRAAVKVTEVQTARAPLVPSSPNIPLLVVAGLLAGLSLGLLVLVARNRLDTRIRSLEDVSLLSNYPLLGAMPLDRQLLQDPLRAAREARSPAGEAIRRIQTNLRFVNTDAELKSLVVTSSLPGEGKSTLVANLALTVASAGLKTIVVDADLRRPRLADRFGLEGGLGLTDLLVGDVARADAIQTYGDSGLHFLPAGGSAPNPSELLQSDAFMNLLEHLESSYDMVLLDAPPLLPVSDAALLARRSSGAILLVAVNNARREQVVASLASIEQVQGRVFGSVATMVPARKDGYGYAYGYEYSDGAQ